MRLQRFSALAGFAAVVMAGMAIATNGIAGDAAADKVTNITTGALPVTDEKATAAAVIKVEGFRSARFGMSEKEVLAAIKQDFDASGKAITSSDNKPERTKILSISAKDVLPGGGMAEISYVFGYQSKKLIQVGISWSEAVDKKMSPEQLFTNANMLRSHFVAAGYKPETIATNMPINNGLLMFRGSDVEGRTTLLMLQGTIAQSDNNQRILKPNALSLFYVADAKKPDIYRLPPGSF